MTMSDLNLTNLIFGRLSLEAIPYHEPILIGTFAMVAIGGLALLAVMLSIALRWAELESHPFAQGGGWAWPLAFGVLYMVLRRAEPAYHSD